MEGSAARCKEQERTKVVWQQKNIQSARKKKKDVNVCILEKGECLVLLFCLYTEILFLEKIKALKMNSWMVSESISSFGENKT